MRSRRKHQRPPQLAKRLGRQLRQPDWESVARFAVATICADAVRAGVCGVIEIKTPVEELRLDSPEYTALWREPDASSYDEGVKTIDHPSAGLLSLEYSAFSVNGRPELTMVVCTPATDTDAAGVRNLVATYS